MKIKRFKINSIVLIIKINNIIKKKDMSFKDTADKNNSKYIITHSISTIII